MPGFWPATIRFNGFHTGTRAPCRRGLRPLLYKCQACHTPVCYLGGHLWDQGKGARFRILGWNQQTLRHATVQLCEPLQQQQRVQNTSFYPRFWEVLRQFRGTFRCGLGIVGLWNLGHAPCHFLPWETNNEIPRGTHNYHFSGLGEQVGSAIPAPACGILHRRGPRPRCRVFLLLYGVPLGHRAAFLLPLPPTWYPFTLGTTVLATCTPAFR